MTVVSILTSVFPAGARGKALGLNVAMTYTGLSTGPYLGGLLTKYFGWRSIFIAVAVIGIFVVISLFKLKQEWSEAKGEKMGLFGIGNIRLVSFGNNIGFFFNTAGVGNLVNAYRNSFNYCFRVL